MVGHIKEKKKKSRVKKDRVMNLFFFLPFYGLPSNLSIGGILLDLLSIKTFLVGTIHKHNSCSNLRHSSRIQHHHQAWLICLHEHPIIHSSNTMLNPYGRTKESNDRGVLQELYHALPNYLYCPSLL